MILKLQLYKKSILVLFLILFSAIINQFYGNKGAFPIDSFLHFDTSYRILNGDIPFSDFWMVSGPAVNYIQVPFFYFFGVNWTSYVLHASLMNVIITIATFFVLKNFKLNINYCFLYSFLFSILAYPSSGTPFVDHHSTFFSLLGIYSLLLAINDNKKIYWIIMPIFFGLSFLSKQVPAAYIILSVFFILVFFNLKNKTLKYFNYILVSSLIFIIFVLAFGYFQKINLSSFIDQYILYPQTIGSDRYENFNFTFRGVIAHFKFIYLAFIPMIYVFILKFKKQKKIINNEIFILLILFSFTFSMILHQLMTKNQTFIFFLIPLLTAFSHISLKTIETKLNKPIYLLIIIICVFSVFKYHLRFNEDRKFHEMANVNFNLTIDAKEIDYKLAGLNWITPDFKENPRNEVDFINSTRSHLKNDNRKKMVLSNYTFFSVILEEKLHSPSWAFADDGTTHPMIGNKYLKKYKNLMIKNIKKNKIEVIYIIGMLDDKHIYYYLDKECVVKKLIFENLSSYELKSCKDLNS